MTVLMEPGAVLAAYRSSRPLLIALAALNALAVTGVAILVTVDGGWRGTWLTAAAAAYALASLLLSWITLRVSGRSLVIHPDWFDYRTSTESLQARWDQVDAVYATPPGLLGRRGLLGRYDYRLQVCGRRVDAGPGVGADAHLGEIVAERTLPHLRNRSLARLRSGRPVRFGRVTLEPGSLVVRAWPPRHIDLEEVGAHRLAHGRLTIQLKGRRRPLHLPLARMPNAALLLDLLACRPDWQGAAAKHRAQRPNNARTKNQRLEGRSAMRRVK